MDRQERLQALRQILRRWEEARTRQGSTLSKILSNV
jgi:hypothetical protein